MNKKHRYALTLCLVFLFFFAFTQDVRADQVVLDNGDTLSGTIEKIVAGKLTLKTEYAGSIDIDITKIKKVSTTSPVEVHLQDGEVLKGQLTTEENGQIKVQESEQRQATTFDWIKVASINPPPSEWTGSIVVGANDQTGNTHRNGASLAIAASRKTDIDKFSLGYQFNYSQENGKVTARNHYGYLHYDYFFTKKWYGYLGTELLSDTFRDLKLRVAVGPGAGYQFWDDPIKSLSLEAGLSYIHESHETRSDEDFLSARIGGNFKYNIANFIIFTDGLILYPRLDHVGRYLLHNEAALSAPLGSAWALRFANILDHDSNPSPGRAENDIQWLLGMQYAF
jgi:putative salt-induced outer membrane protein YdiY